MRQILISYCLIILLLNAACALSPQIINISPELDYEDASSNDHNNSITIQVIDARENHLLGSRGGIYSDTASLTTNTEMTNNIRSALVDAFTALGYQVSERTLQTELTVSITELSYNNQKQSAVNTIATRAAVKVECQNQRVKMDNDYTITDRKDFIKLPSENENTRLVNSSLASALNRIFRDQNLLSCLDS